MRPQGFDDLLETPVCILAQLVEHIVAMEGPVHDRSRVLSANLRKPEMLPPQEIISGVIDVVRANFGASQEQIVSTILHLLGFKSTSVGCDDHDLRQENSAPARGFHLRP